MPAMLLPTSTIIWSTQDITQTVIQPQDPAVRKPGYNIGNLTFPQCHVFWIKTVARSIGTLPLERKFADDDPWPNFASPLEASCSCSLYLVEKVVSKRGFQLNKYPFVNTISNISASLWKKFVFRKKFYNTSDFVFCFFSPLDAKKKFHEK